MGAEDRREGEGVRPVRCDILVRNGFVVTMDPARTVYPSGAVAIDGNTIVAIGPESALERRYRPRRTIDAGGALVHPGLIEGHYHITHHLTRGVIPDDPDEPAVGGVGTDGEVKPALYSQWANALEDEDEYASALLGATEMVCNGYTFLMEPGTAFEPDTVATAVEAVGIRASLADPFLWDESWGTQLAAEVDRAPADRTRALSLLGRELRRNRDPARRVSGHLSLYGSGSASDELQRAAKACADENGVVFNKHESFTPEGVAEATRRYGKAPLLHDAELGLLSPNTSYVHLNVLDDAEMDVIAKSGMSVVWHPGNFMFYGLARRCAVGCRSFTGAGSTWRSAPTSPSSGPSAISPSWPTW